MLPTSHYDKERADHAVNFIQSLKHTKGVWAGKPFLLFDWQEKIIRDIFGTIKPTGYRQFNTAFVEICKKAGKSELAAAIALYMLAGDGEEGAEIYGCANDRQQASIVFDVAKDMVLQCPALLKRIKIVESQKRLVYLPTRSIYQALSSEVASKYGYNVHACIGMALRFTSRRRPPTAL
jgi:phage terminase large subunit-like protein